MNNIKKFQLSKIANALNKGGNCNLYIVGGTVRNIVKASGPINANDTLKETDLDLATNLLPDECFNRLEDADIRTIATGIQHGTLTAVDNGRNIEITTFREPSSRRLTAFSQTIEEDLAGRDFTINAIAIDLATDKIIDPFNGKKDLENKILRTVGKPDNRFIEDPLRILRMVRFGDASGFTISDETLTSAKDNIEKLSNISIERIREEFVKILLSKFPAQGIRLLDNISALELILPELIPSIGFEQNEYHIHDVFEHILWVIERAKPTAKARLSALFHDIGKPESFSVGEDGRRHFYQHEVIGAEITRKAMKRLKFSKRMTKDVSELVYYHMRPFICGPSTVRRLKRDLGELLNDWIDLKLADKSPTIPDSQLESEYLQFKEILDDENRKSELCEREKLVVNGHDLMRELNLPAGKELGNIIRKCKDLILEDPEKNNKSDLISYARKIKG